MTQHFGYCPSANEGDNKSEGSSVPVITVYVLRSEEKSLQQFHK